MGKQVLEMKKSGCPLGERFDFKKQKCVPHPYKHDSLPTIVKKSKDIAINILNKHGIFNPLTVKIKEFKGYRKGFLACYRNGTQFSSHPIFWINKDLNNIIMESEVEFCHRINEYTVISDNILHEYAHVIYEWAQFRNPALRKMIDNRWKNEEDFAEGFIDYARDSMFNVDEEKYDQVMETFKKDIQWTQK